MTNTKELEHQVSLTLGDHIEDFDIPAIVRDLIAAAPGGTLGNIDDVEHDAYWAIVSKHDQSKA